MSLGRRSVAQTLVTLSLSALAITPGALALAQPQPPPPPPPPGVTTPPPPVVAPTPAPAPAPAPPPVAPPSATPEPVPPVAGPLPDAPPPPPPAGKSPMPEAPPGPPKSFPLEPEVGAKRDGPPLAGFNGGFFLRDAHDNFRLYPRGRVQVDFNSYFGEGVSKVLAPDGGNALKNRLFMRRARLELGGEFFQSISFHMSIEAGGQPLSNANGKAQTAAAGVDKDPTKDSARWAPVQLPSATAALADEWINYSVCPCLNFMIGQYDAPFSMENRTSDTVSDWMELNLPIRSFVVPIKKEIGLTVWGEFGEKNLNYELGVFMGDGQNRPQVDNSVDLIGRVFARPFAKKDSKELLAKAQIGVSMRHGERDQDYVGYSYPGITSSQGFTLWDPRYKDSAGHTNVVIPSGAQNAIGGELRLPLSIVDLRGEAYYVVNDTREAIDGYQLTNTQRLGRIKGLGWYASISAWPFGDAYINGDPGVMRPLKVDVTKEADKPKKGLQLLAIVAGVNASYSGAARGGDADAKTPGTTTTPGKIRTFEYGLGANYWYSKHLRVSLNYVIYHTPGSGSAENLGVVPGNLIIPVTDADAETKKSAHVLHELSTRVAVAF